MIIDFKRNYNTYSEEILNNYDVFEYICPSCGAKHSFIRHATYERNVSFIDKDNSVKETRITVLRLLCKSCKRTHAILPNDIIPYCIYSFSYIIHVLTERFVACKNITDICGELGISFQILYIFINRFLMFADSCAYVLINLGFINPDNRIKKLLVYIHSYEKVYHDFSAKYFFFSAWMFLMSKFKNILPCPIYIGGSG
jgi:hypothetical protein